MLYTLYTKIYKGVGNVKLKRKHQQINLWYDEICNLAYNTFCTLDFQKYCEKTLKMYDNLAFLCCFSLKLVPLLDWGMG